MNGRHVILQETEVKIVDNEMTKKERRKSIPIHPHTHCVRNGEDVDSVFGNLGFLSSFNFHSQAY